MLSKITTKTPNETPRNSAEFLLKLRFSGLSELRSLPQYPPPRRGVWKLRDETQRNVVIFYVKIRHFVYLDILSGNSELPPNGF